MQSNGSNAPNVEGRVPSQLCHFGKRRAAGNLVYEKISSRVSVHEVDIMC